MFSTPTSLIAFAGASRIASGPPLQVALTTATWLAANPSAQVLVFDAETGHQAELDLRGSAADVERRLTLQLQAQAPAAGDAPRPAKGRPKLGVVAREVTLLPRHWDWLAAQPGGASVSLRKLVEQAARANPDQQTRRARTEAAYRFMLAMAGNEAHFEEASRALFAEDHARLTELMRGWPCDVSEQIRAMLTSPVACQGQSQ